MAYGNWDDIWSSYHGHQNVGRSFYRQHIRAMLSLVPRLRDLDELRNTIPVTSHLTLYLCIPDSKKAVCIWGESPHMYRVYVHSDDMEPSTNPKYEFEQLCPDDVIIPVIIRLVSKLTSEVERNA